jgi:predicted CoA-binding protein
MPADKLKEFYDSGSFSLIGMSHKKTNFAWGVHKSFTGAGKKVYALHPDGGEKKGVKFYRDFNELPEKTDACIVCTDLKNNQGLISELADSGIGRVWFQQGSYDDNTLETARKAGMSPLTGCVFMYFPEASFLHKVHRFLYELLGKGKV